MQIIFFKALYQVYCTEVLVFNLLDVFFLEDNSFIKLHKE